ncbi:DNA N-6-adenine-methyltransferase [Geovibrio ferrireducens]|uniref:DNA N-6-adenine-methyltransferase n=1 Tax=Geovibrio ferrireducens TaxID=46201 RepID=UPI0022462B7F|nr:DNA N-6-adenine-methyltransferase [Geovibrio ferrireducens]
MSIFWETPWSLFRHLDSYYKFTLDAAANPQNAKCASFYTEADNGLTKPWYGRVFQNPPYGRKVGEWLKKAIDEIQHPHCERVVGLIPASTDTKWFHEYVLDCENASHVFLKGRIWFIDAEGNVRKESNVCSAIVEWSRFQHILPTIPIKPSAEYNKETLSCLSH